VFWSLSIWLFKIVSDFVLALRRRLRRESDFEFGCGHAALGYEYSGPLGQMGCRHENTEIKRDCPTLPRPCVIVTKLLASG